MRIVLTSWVLAFALACSPTAEMPLSTESDAAREHFREALEQFHQQRMSRALSGFEAALSEDPRFALASAYAAIAMNYTGDVEARRQAALENRHAASASEQLAIDGLVAWSLSDYERAVEAHSALLEREPDLPRAHFERSWFHYRLRRYEDAAADAAAAVALDEGFVPAHLLLARAQLAMEHLDAALVSADRAIRVDEESPGAHTTRGDVLLRAGRLDEAVASYESALAIDASHVPALAGRANTLRIAARYDDAVPAYRALCDATKGLEDGSYKELFLDWTKAEDVCFDYGMTHLLMGELDEAASIFEAAAHYTYETRMANAPIFYNSLGRFFLETGQLEQARAVYDRSLEISREAGVSERMRKLWDGRYLLARARLAAKAERFAEAHEHAGALAKMIEEAGEEGEPFLPAYHYMMGYVLLEEGRFEEARGHLEKSRLEDPFNRWLLARAHAGMGELERAREIVTELSSLHPGSYGHALAVHDALAFLEEHGSKAVVGAHESANDAETVVARAIRYAEGEDGRWDNKKTVAYTKTTTYFAPDGSVERTAVEKHSYRLRPRLAMRIEREEDGKPVVLVNDDGRAFKIVDGKTLTDPKSVQQARNPTFGSHFMFSLPFKLRDDGAVFRSVSERSLEDGTETDAVIVEYQEDAGDAGGLHTWTFYFGKNGRMEGVHLKHGPSPSQQSFTRYEDEQSIAGLTLPTARANWGYTEDGTRAHKRNEVRYTDIRFDVELPDGLFAPES